MSGIEAQTIITAGNPFGAGLAQFGQACGQRIFFQFVRGRRLARRDDFGRRVFRLADLQMDGRYACGCVNALHGFTQAGERIGFEVVQ